MHCASNNLALLPPLMQKFKRFKLEVGQRYAAMDVIEQTSVN